MLKGKTIFITSTLLLCSLPSFAFSLELLGLVSNENDIAFSKEPCGEYEHAVKRKTLYKNKRKKAKVIGIVKGCQNKKRAGDVPVLLLIEGEQYFVARYELKLDGNINGCKTTAEERENEIRKKYNVYRKFQIHYC